MSSVQIANLWPNRKEVTKDFSWTEGKPTFYFYKIFEKYVFSYILCLHSPKVILFWNDFQVSEILTILIDLLVKNLPCQKITAITIYVLDFFV